MLPSRLIFVDGLPGSGKSTTAQRLSLHLRRQGYPARWSFEHENQHPLFVESAVRALREQQPNAAPALFDRALTGYAMLTDRMSAVPPETLLLEGTLFQTAVGSQLLLDHSQADIETFFDRTLKTVAALNPALIHLAPADPVAALHRTAETRGSWFPDFVLQHLRATPLGQRLAITDWSGAVALLTKHRALCDALFERFPGPKIAVDPSIGDWNQINAAITSFLQLPPLIEPPPAADLAQVAGAYRAEGTDDTWEFVVNADGLALAGPPLTRLWARPEGGFEIEGLAIELDFELDATGRGVAVHCAPRINELPLHWLRV